MAMAIVFLSAIKEVDPAGLSLFFFSSLPHQLDTLWAWCSPFFSAILAASYRSFIDTYLLLSIYRHVLQNAAACFFVCGCSCCCAGAVPE
jgi:hypothetical protein